MTANPTVEPPPAAPLQPDASPAVDVVSRDTASSDSAAAPTPRGPLNVLYLTIDSLRSDVLHPRGASPAAFGEDPAVIAPTLTALAREGVTYTHAYAGSSYTSQSVGAMYGGRIPSELPRDGYFFGEYRNAMHSLAERITEGGGLAFAAHAHFYFARGASGLEQGFTRWELLPGLVRNQTTDVEVTSERLVTLVRDELTQASASANPWFLHAHFMDPHDQYKRHAGAPTMNTARGARALYLQEVWFTDSHLAALLTWVRAQPWAARTAIIVSADHGESFGEHGHFRHGFYLWEELTRVPWIFVIPGANPRTIEVARSHLDLAPTVLDLMGLPAASDLPGHSLRAELEGGDAPARVVWTDLAQTSDNDHWRARIDGSLVALARGNTSNSFYVYDLAVDPEERSPLPRTDPRRAAAIDAFRSENAQWHDLRPDQWRPPVAAH